MEEIAEYHYAIYTDYSEQEEKIRLLLSQSQNEYEKQKNMLSYAAKTSVNIKDIKNEVKEILRPLRKKIQNLEDDYYTLSLFAEMHYKLSKAADRSQEEYEKVKSQFEKDEK